LISWTWSWERSEASGNEDQVTREGEERRGKAESLEVEAEMLKN
jgi:hypothetical protein